MIRARRILALMLLLPALAAAQLRTLPEDAKRGNIQHVTETLVSIDGQEMRLAPGATIRNQQNLIIVPTALPREGAEAQYLLDGNGQISRVWLLTPEEAARPRARSR